MSINNSLIQDTLYDWVVSVISGIPVLWRNQEAPQKTFPYVNLWIRGVDSWGDRDERKRDFDEDRPAGEEVHQTSKGPREIRVDLDVWTHSNDADTDCVNLGEQLLDGLQSDAVRAILRAGGVSFLRVVFRRQLSQVEGEAQINRFYAEILFCVLSSRVEKSGYIDTVVVSSDPTNVPDYDITQTVTTIVD